MSKTLVNNNSELNFRGIYTYRFYVRSASVQESDVSQRISVIYSFHLKFELLIYDVFVLRVRHEWTFYS